MSKHSRCPHKPGSKSYYVWLAKTYGRKTSRMARTPKRLKKYAAAVKAGKVRRNRKGQITKVLVGRGR